MRTQLLGTLPLEQDRLDDDLNRSASFHYSEPYTEFLCGRPWKSVMLWASGGEVGDDVIAHYDTSKASAATPFGEQVPYLTELISRSFAVEHLTFARLAVMTDSVLVPHRDYVELADTASSERAAHRLHVALSTNENCLFAEDNHVFRMKVGEVWFLDVSRPHSAGVLSDFHRAHLILDFADVPDGQSLTTFDVRSAEGIPEASRRQRPPLSEKDREGLLALESVVNLDNLRDVFGIVIKTHYRHDGGPTFVWDTMREIARRSEDHRVRAKIEEMHDYYMLERDE